MSYNQTISNQTSLFNTGKKILDATCSYAHIWPKFATVRIDIRPETKPDMVMDAKNLKFPDNYFDEIYCDPPHLLRKSDDLTKANFRQRQRGRKLSLLQRYYFWHNMDEWLIFVEKTNKEFFRCLKPNGTVYYKMTDAKGAVTIKSLIDGYTNFKLIEDKAVKSKVNWKTSNSMAHYITFRRQSNDTN